MKALISQQEVVEDVRCENGELHVYTRMQTMWQDSDGIHEISMPVPALRRFFVGVQSDG